MVNCSIVFTKMQFILIVMSNTVNTEQEPVYSSCEGYSGCGGSLCRICASCAWISVLLASALRCPPFRDRFLFLVICVILLRGRTPRGVRATCMISLASILPSISASHLNKYILSSQLCKNLMRALYLRILIPIKRFKSNRPN